MWPCFPRPSPSLRAWTQDPVITATSLPRHTNELNPNQKPICSIRTWIWDGEYYLRKITQPRSLILKMHANRAAPNPSLPYLLAGFGHKPTDKHFPSPSVFSDNIISVVFNPLATCFHYKLFFPSQLFKSQLDQRFVFVNCPHFSLYTNSLD